MFSKEEDRIFASAYNTYEIGNNKPEQLNKIGIPPEKSANFLEWVQMHRLAELPGEKAHLRKMSKPKNDLTIVPINGITSSLPQHDSPVTPITVENFFKKFPNALERSQLEEKYQRLLRGSLTNIFDETAQESLRFSDYCSFIEGLDPLEIAAMAAQIGSSNQSLSTITVSDVSSIAGLTSVPASVAASNTSLSSFSEPEVKTSSRLTITPSAIAASNTSLASVPEDDETKSGLTALPEVKHKFGIQNEPQTSSRKGLPSKKQSKGNSWSFFRKDENKVSIGTHTMPEDTEQARSSRNKWNCFC